MQMDETMFRRNIMAACEAFGWHVSSIEAHCSAAGIPDLNIHPDSSHRMSPRPDVWLELKMVREGHVKLRPTQRRWHRERHEAGGKSWVAALDRRTGDILLVPGHVAAGIDTRAESWRAVAEVSNVSSGLTSWVNKLAMENEYGKQ